MPSPRWKTLDGTPTKVIAHRGASGLLPEHTLEAYALAIEQGADLIEPDLVVTRDGVLLARHDRGLKRSTDISRRPEFASRARRLEDGTGDWHVDDFTYAELRGLRAVQPYPGRPHEFDGRLAIPRFEEVLELAAAESGHRGRPIGVYPELKHPAAFATAGLDITGLTITALDARGLRGKSADIWVQCFEAEPLRRVHEALGLRTFALCDKDARARAGLLDDVQRTAHAALGGIAVHKSALQDDGSLVAQAHERGWQVHVWTFRDDDPSSSTRARMNELVPYFDLGVDAVFTDFPATAVTTRSRRLSSGDS